MPLPPAFAASLRKLLGNRCAFDAEICAPFGKGSITIYPAAPPDAVAWPLETAEVSALARLAYEHHVPIVGRGAGTSLEGQVHAVEGGVCISFERMDKLLSWNTTDRQAVVQPGLMRDVCNEALAAEGLWYPYGPGINTSFGGMASTRASGLNAVRYGTVSDAVMALEVVQADGTVIRTGSRAQKSSAGYDLTHLFVGSEGTLGLITELTVRLQPKPAKIAVIMAAFPDLERAVAAALDLRTADLSLGALELADELQMLAAIRYSAWDGPDRPTLMIELSGTSEEVDTSFDLALELLRPHGCETPRTARDEASRQKLWNTRADAAWAALSLRDGAEGYITDVCVPFSRLYECITAARRILQDCPLPAPMIGHVGDGNFHFMFLVDPNAPAEWKTAQGFHCKIVELALACDGTCTGEHGIGIGKRHYLREEHGAAVETMRRIKDALDPRGILNPGKVLPAPTLQTS